VFKLLAGFMYVYVVLVWILSGIMHLWTVYIAYSFGGLFWGIVSFFFPVISELYWGFVAWRIDGFNSAYIQWLIVLVIIWVLQYVFTFFLSLLENKFSKDINY
jgi:hypothetical protein